MYIETYWVVIGAVWIIYLLWRTSVWNNKVQEITNQYDQLLKTCAIHKYRLTKKLAYTILKSNQDVLKKAPKKLREKALTDEAERLILAIYYYNNDIYDDATWLVLEDFFGIQPVFLAPSEDGKTRINVNKTVPRLAKQLEELLDADLSYLEE